MLLPRQQLFLLRPNSADTVAALAMVAHMAADQATVAVASVATVDPSVLVSGAYSLVAMAEAATVVAMEVLLLAPEVATVVATAVATVVATVVAMAASVAMVVAELEDMEDLPTVVLPTEVPLKAVLSVQEDLPVMEPQIPTILFHLPVLLALPTEPV